MSEETTRPDDEVEAHGPVGGCRRGASPTRPLTTSPTSRLTGQSAACRRRALSPEAEATDDEPDVEAHGPVGGMGPSGMGPSGMGPSGLAPTGL